MQGIFKCAVGLVLVSSLMTHLGRADSAPAPTPIPIWPSRPPGEVGDTGAEKEQVDPNDSRRVVRISNVSSPTIHVYIPDAKLANGAAVIVCPGGGYNILAYEHEGTEVCQWLNSKGVTAVLLKYRVPAREGRPRHEAPLQDLQRTIGIVRSRAVEWGIDPNRVGVIGFSAGGHLAAVASTNFDKRAFERVDEADDQSARPDFVMLIYPAYLVREKDKTKLAPELRVTENTPPTFMVMTQDDRIGVENVLVYAKALKDAKVEAELHIYPKGGHGYGLRKGKHPVSTEWPLLAEKWMRNGGWLTAKN